MTTKPDYQTALEFVIAQCWADRSRNSKTFPDGTEVYAYRIGMASHGE